jgi:hypothetical protein
MLWAETRTAFKLGGLLVEPTGLTEARLWLIELPIEARSDILGLPRGSQRGAGTAKTTSPHRFDRAGLRSVCLGKIDAAPGTKMKSLDTDDAT